MGTVIAITSGKGGTGKTSVTGGVASWMARRGRRVLCIDLDIGLRNLDITLGLSDRAMMDFSDVVEGRCSLARSVVSHPKLPGLHLLTAPLSLSPQVGPMSFHPLLQYARSQYDYIFMDAPAGLGTGFQLAVCHADRAFVVSTHDASSLRDAQRVVTQLHTIPQVHLIMNRIQPKLLRQLRTTIDQAMDTAGLPLIGVVPEDPQVMLTANQGSPLILGGRQGATRACLNIARRMEGHRVSIMRIR